MATLSGEFSATETLKIKNSYEDYWPLPRVVEGRPEGKAGGGGGR